MKWQFPLLNQLIMSEKMTTMNKIEFLIDILPYTY